MNFFFEYILRPLLNLLLFVMKESRQNRKQDGMQVEREMQPQLKKRLPVWRIRDLLKGLIRQERCEGRFKLFIEEDIGKVSVFSVTEELLFEVRFHENDFELIYPGYPDRRVESEEFLKELVYQHMTEMIAWHKDVMTLGGKRR